MIYTITPSIAACLFLNENITITTPTGSTPLTNWSTTSDIWTTTTGNGAIGGCNTGWIGDGYCDDIDNNVECNFDGGDCCGPNVNTNYCTECLCLNENVTTTNPTGSTSTTTWSTSSNFEDSS